MTTTFDVRPERPEDGDAIDAINLAAFGPGAATRAAAFLREGVPHEPRLAFVGTVGGEVAGTVRQTPVRWGRETVWMLGPLAVAPHLKNVGIGRALMRTSVREAETLALEAGAPRAIILVGDLAYYAPFGFTRIETARIRLPRPADPARILACDLAEGASAAMSGPVTRFPGR